MVLVRHTNAGIILDVYVFKNIQQCEATRIFLLQNLAQGDARISGYNTVMTAEVDPNSSMNASKPTAAWTKDLFRKSPVGWESGQLRPGRVPWHVSRPDTLAG